MAHSSNDENKNKEIFFEIQPEFAEELKKKMGLSNLRFSLF